MSMKAAVFVTGCGNAFFSHTFIESWKRFTKPVETPLYYMMDEKVGVTWRRWSDICALHYMLDKKLPFIQIGDVKSKGSINRLWNSVVDVANHHEYDIAIVCNDDIYLAPGWLEAILNIFEKNPKVALCGIPAPGALQDELHVRERWFMDESLFYGPDFWKIVQSHKGTPPKYEPWTSGFLWACRVKPWLEHAVIPSDKIAWGYGEPWMGLKLHEAGWHTVSIYDPLILHFGGGAYWTVGVDTEARRTHNATIGATGGDAKNFAAVYGTSELGDLHEQWKRQVEGVTFPVLQY